MKILIADASSLILLTKARVLEVLVKIATVLVPGAVHDEVCSERHVHQYSDAGVIARLVADGSLEVRRISQCVQLPVSLGKGESEAICLFIQEKADAVLTDDGRAIRACRLLGVPYLPSPRLVVEMVHSGQLAREDAARALERLALYGRYRADVIAAAIEQLSVENGRR